MEGSFCLEALGIPCYYDAPLLHALVKSSYLQEKEASKTCQGVACTRFSRASHALEQSSHLQVLGGDKIYWEVSCVHSRCDLWAVNSYRRGWVVGTTCLEASCIDSHCDAFLEHDLVECTHQ